MPLLAALDFETEFRDPFDPKEMRITEVGAVLFDTETKTPVSFMSELVWSDSHKWDNRITEVCGIPWKYMVGGRHPVTVLPQLLSFIQHANYIVAHNGNQFDKIVLQAECARYNLDFPTQPWIDTTCDIPYPKKIETRKLVHLACEHGFINPFAHRALFDTMTMLEILSRYDFEEIIKRQATPNIIVRAVVKKPFGETAVQGKIETDQAKARGYRFDGTNKIWTKTIKENEYADEAKDAPFQVVILRDSNTPKS